jgi:hypothetical protein
MGNLRRGLVVFAVVAAAVVVFAGTASADYGQGTAYQVEITANLSGPQGGGIWLWLALTPTSETGGTVDYSGADCGHGVGSVSDKGEATYTISGGNLVISGVAVNGLAFFGLSPATITVPASYGHWSYPATDPNPFEAIFGFPAQVGPLDFTGGRAQVQVAP